MQILRDKQVVLGVCGSIAAYKSVYLTRLLVGAGAQVWPILSPGASRFVAPLSFAALAGRRPVTDLWEQAQGGEIGHVELAHRADAVVLAPLTANSLARLSQGHADDPLSALVLSARAPLLLAPAMESGMWDNAATQEHLLRLQARGALLVPPEAGSLASGRSGMGRMAEPEQILLALEAALLPQDLRGEHVLVTAGPTREAFDPARYISNPSTGKMGYALARAAQARGARVHLIAGPTALPNPAGMECTRVTSTQDMLEACSAALPPATLLLMAAAPADYRPVAYSPDKLKKRAGGDKLNLALESTPDILATLMPRTVNRLVVGFAAETGDVVQHGQEKLQRKNLDMLLANQVGTATTGFGSDTNAGWLLRPDTEPLTLPLMSKAALAHVLLDHVVAERRRRTA